jgi:hypothetical protein
MPHEWSPPTVTETQSLDPTSSSTGNRRMDVVGSLHAAAHRIASIAGLPIVSTTARRATNDMNLSKGFRAALVFGIVAATIEMGLILWMARC